MFKVEVEHGKNLLRVSYSGATTAEEMQRCAKEVQVRLSELATGFRLLTDLTALESMEAKAVPHIRRMMDLCNGAGVALVVRVIPDPHKDIGLNIMSLFHYHRRVRIVTCQNLEEAKRALG
jgi:sugar phosphate isomerase/epimerase